MDELLQQFLVEAPELIQAAGDALLALEADGTDRGRLDAAFRTVHTLKGSVALFDMAALGEALHAAETVLAQARSAGQAPGRAALDALLHLLASTETWLAELGADGALPPGAADSCRAIALQLEGAAEGSAPPAPVAPSPRAPPAWAQAYLARQGEEGRAPPRVLLRYAPDAQAFFRGEDPLERLRGVPGLRGLEAAPAEPWPHDRARYQPLLCQLVFTAGADAPVEAVRAALRLAGGGVELVEVAAPPPARPAGEVDAAPAAAEGPARRLRVDPVRVDALMELADELVALASGLGAGRAEPGALQRLERLAGQVHEAVARVRLAPLQRTFERLPRLVREVSAQLGKPAALELEGEGLEADRAVVDALYEPLLHLLRNALDHGLEPPAGRQAAGKPPVGRLRLLAHAQAGEIRLELSDDGRGVDLPAVRRRGEAQGLVAPGVELDEVATLDLLFQPGFSTAEAVSAVSGRGVGLDSVRRSVEALGGRVWMEQARGQGARTVIVLPAGAVLTRLLRVEVGGETYGAPLLAVREVVRLARSDAQPVGEGWASPWRGRTLPLLHLHDRLEGGRPQPGMEARAAGADLRVLVVDGEDGDPVGLVVDRLRGRLEGVVRPLGGLLSGLLGVAGVTQDADGELLFVLDLERLARWG